MALRRFPAALDRRGDRRKPLHPRRAYVYAVGEHGRHMAMDRLAKEVARLGVAAKLGFKAHPHAPMPAARVAQPQKQKRGHRKLQALAACSEKQSRFFKVGHLKLPG